jgi:hypothetical protein
MYMWLLGVGFILVVVALIRLRGLPDQKPDRIFALIAGTGGVLVVAVFAWFFIESSSGLTPSPDTPQDELQAAVEGGLGSSNRDVTRVSEARVFAGRVSVVWAINDNLSEGLVKDTARLEATEILEAIQGSGITYDEVSIEGTFSLVDQLGNESEEVVVRGTWERSLIDQINFENFAFKNVFEIAGEAYVHPAFQY